MSQEDLARALSAVGRSYHQTTIAKLESGSRPTPIEELYTLAAILDVDVADLVSPDPGRAVRRQIAGLTGEARQLADELQALAVRQATLQARQKEVDRELEELSEVSGALPPEYRSPFIRETEGRGGEHQEED